MEGSLKVYYEIRNIDSTYPNVVTKISELETEIHVRQEKLRKEAEELVRKQADDLARKRKEQEEYERTFLPQ